MLPRCGSGERVKAALRQPPDFAQGDKLVPIWREDDNDRRGRVTMPLNKAHREDGT